LSQPSRRLPSPSSVLDFNHPRPRGPATRPATADHYQKSSLLSRCGTHQSMLDATIQQKKGLQQTLEAAMDLITTTQQSAPHSAPSPSSVQFLPTQDGAGMSVDDTFQDSEQQADALLAAKRERKRPETVYPPGLSSLAGLLHTPSPPCSWEADPTGPEGPSSANVVFLTPAERIKADMSNWHAGPCPFTEEQRWQSEPSILPSVAQHQQQQWSAEPPPNDQLEQHTASAKRVHFSPQLEHQAAQDVENLAAIKVAQYELCGLWDFMQEVTPAAGDDPPGALPGRT